MSLRVLAVLRRVVAAMVVLAPLLVLYRWQAGIPAAPPHQVVATISGEAEVLRAGATDWEDTSTDALATGDSVRAVALVRVTFHEGTILDLEPGARLTVQKASLGDSAIVVLQESGRLRVETSNPAFRLDGPGLSLAVDKAMFRVEVNGPGDAFIAADRGLVRGTASGETVRVAEGEAVRTGAAQRAAAQVRTPVVLPSPPPPPPRTPTRTATPIPPTVVPQRIHIVTQGDTLTYIATKYNTTVEAIMKANNLDDAHWLSIGQRLIIPP